MSNLLKSKFLLGLMIVAILFVGAFAFMHTASAADCTITKTLKYGMKGAEVTCLQQKLSVTPATGYFGKLTKAAVMAFQADKGLKADGVVGAASRAALAGTVVVGNFPAGCTSASGFSSTTGLPCSGTTTFPAGCTSLVGFSSTTGLPCSSTSTPPVTTSGPLTVSLASDNPAGGTIVAGQATADLAHFNFSGTGTISALTLKRGGVSDQDTLSNVYLYDGVTRLTDAYSFNNAGDLTFSGLSIAVAGSKNISVRADVSSSTLSYDVFVTLTSYTVTGGTANAVSVKGNDMFIASAPSTLGVASFEGTNDTAAADVTPGTTGKQVWSDSLQINNHDLLLKSVNFRTTGSASVDALTNVKMYMDGVAIGSNGVSTTLSGTNYWAFDMSAAPVTLTVGNHTLEVRADIVKGSSYDVTFALQQASDMMLFDAQVGINVTPKTASSTFTANTAGKMSILKGSVSTAVDPTFNSYTTITGGATNVAIAKFKLHGYGEDVKVTSLSFTPVLGSMSPAAAGLQNVTAYFNGSQVGSQTANWSSSPITMTPNSQMIVPAGVDSYLEIKADLRTTASANYVSGTVHATLNSSTGEGMSSHQSVTLAAVTGNTLTVQTGVIAIAANSAYSSQVIAPNTANTKIASFVVQNQSSSESVRVTNLQVALALTTVGSTNYSNLKTSETSGSGANPINPATAAAGQTSTNNFSVDFTIAPGVTKTIDVFTDIGSTAGSAHVTTSLYVTALGATSNVTLCSPSISTGSPAIDGCNSGTAKAGQVMTVAVGTFGTPAVVANGTDTARYIAGGTTTGVTNAATAQFKFTATNGSATISELKFAETGGHGAVTSVSVGSVSAPMVSGVAYLTGLNIPVPQGGTGVTVDAKMSYAPVGATGVATTATGDIDSLMGMSYVKYSMGGTTSTLCDTGCTVSTSMPVDSAQTMHLVGSKPVVTVAKPSGVVLVTGSVEAIDVTIAADTAGPISITSFPISTSLSVGSGATLTVSTGTGHPFTVKDASNNTVNVANTSNFALTTGGAATVTFSSAYTLNAGQSQTFKVFVPVSAFSAGTGTSSMNTNLATGSGFAWIDTAGGASVSIGDITGLIYNYPSTYTSSIGQ